MVRLNLVLAALLVVCALGLVSSQDRARKLFGDLERTHAQAARLEVQWDQLQIEQTALAQASRIDTKARRELAMESISPQRTLHLIVDPVEHVVRLGSSSPETGEGAHASARRPSSAAPAPARPAARTPETRRPAARTPAARSHEASGRDGGAR